MNNDQSTKPAAAVAVISQRLAGLGVFPSAPGESAAELFKTAGVCFASSAANVVGTLASGKLSGAQKRRVGAEAMKMAAVADACMARAASLAQRTENLPASEEPRPAHVSALYALLPLARRTETKEGA